MRLIKERFEKRRQRLGNHNRIIIHFDYPYKGVFAGVFSKLDQRNQDKIFRNSQC